MSTHNHIYILYIITRVTRVWRVYSVIPRVLRITNPCITRVGRVCLYFQLAYILLPLKRTLSDGFQLGLLSITDLIRLDNLLVSL